jgi:hypothetical protein
MAAAPKADEKPTASKETFWEQLRSLGDRWQTEDFSLYVYRLWPVTDTRNPERFLCKLAEPIDEDFLLKNYGSGKYLLMLNQRGKRVRTHVANPHNLQYPPAVHPNEVVASDPVNKLFFDVWAAAKDGHSPSTAQGSKEAATETNTILNTVLAKTGAFDPKLAELWEKAAKERDELSKALAAKNAPPDVLEIVKAVKDLFPSQASTQQAVPARSEALIVVEALKNLQPPQQDMLAVLRSAKDLFAPAAPASKEGESSRIAELRELLEFSHVLMGGTSQRNGWDVALDAARDVALPVVQTVGNIIMQSMALRQGQPVPGTSATPPAATAWDPYRNQAQTAAYAATLRNKKPQPATPPTPQPPPAAPPPQPTPSAAPPQQPAGQPDNQILSIFQQYGALVLNALNQGVSGDAFADYVSGLLGTSTHAMIANHGEDALVSTMLSIPEFQLFGETKVRRFVWEFIHYEELGDEPDDESEGKRAAASRG